MHTNIRKIYSFIKVQKGEERGLLEAKVINDSLGVTDIEEICTWKGVNVILVFLFLFPRTQ